MLLFVMLDALRHDYINYDDSPFLYSLISKSLSGSVTPSFGFEPDAAYLAGLQPDEANGGAMFWLDPDHSPFRFTRFLPALLEKLPRRPARFVRQGIRLIAQLSAKNVRTRYWASPAWIPLPLLHRFSFVSTHLIYEPGFLPKPTIFDHLRTAGRAWYFHGIPNYHVAAEKVCSRFLAEFTGLEDYAYLHIGDLDSVGHCYGPWSEERRATLHNVDRYLEKIITHARAKAGQTDLLILGDHGMVQVERTLDVQTTIQRLHARGLSFDYFIDATLFRCWSQDAGVLTALRNEFNRLPGLLEIGQEERLRYSLCYHHNRFWDICWQAEAGLMLTPNFHNNHDRLLGMHGYLPGSPGNQSTFVLNSPRLPVVLRGQCLQNVDMRRFYTTQLSLLDLPQISSFAWSLV